MNTGDWMYLKIKLVNSEVLLGWGGLKVSAVKWKIDRKNFIELLQ